MAKLLVKSKGQLLQEVPLDEGQEYIAGRKETSAILLPQEKGISREHFKLFFEDGSWNLKVISTYGKVFSSGIQVELTTLIHGQKFQVPPLEFEFIGHENTVALAEPKAPDSKIDSNQGSSLVPMDDEKTYVKPKSVQVPYLKFLNTMGEVRELLKMEGSGPWIAGREGDIHIIISDSRVSRRQFEISLINSQYYIKDLGSSNGTLLKGEMLSSVDKSPIKSGDTIRVLENEIIFELRDPQFEKMAKSSELSIYTPSVPMEQQLQIPGDGSAGISNMDMMVPQAHWPSAPSLGGYPQPMSGGELAPSDVAVSPLDKFKNLDPKKKMIYGIAAVGLLVIVLFGDVSGDKQPSDQDIDIGKTPFEKLKPEDQSLVMHTYGLIKNYKMQNNFEICIQSADVILKLLPNGYEDVQNLRSECLNSKIRIEDNQKFLRDEKEKKDREDKILLVVSQCEKQLNANTTKAEMEDCLKEAILLDPLHSRVTDLQGQVEAIEQQRQQEQEDQRMYQEKVAALQRLFDNAERISRKNISPYDIMPEYEKVIESSLPDPRGLKARSREKINSLKNTIYTKTKSYVEEARQNYASGDIKKAITLLKSAKQVDPQNTNIDELISKYTIENKQKLRPIYEESVVEEKFGNIEAAIERWKKIIENDNPDGEYYFKAYKKLKDYGALSR